MPFPLGLLRASFYSGFYEVSLIVRSIVRYLDLTSLSEPPMNTGLATNQVRYRQKKHILNLVDKQKNYIFASLHTSPSNLPQHFEIFRFFLLLIIYNFVHLQRTMRIVVCEKVQDFMG